MQYALQIMAKYKYWKACTAESVIKLMGQLKPSNGIPVDILVDL